MGQQGRSGADRFARRAAVEFTVFIGLAFLVSAGIGLGLTELLLRGVLVTPEAPARAAAVYVGTAMICGLAAAFALSYALGGAMILRPYLALRERERDAVKRAAIAGRLALVARRASDMVLILDRDGRVEWANDSFREIWGRGDAAGRWPPDLLPLAGGESLEDDYLAALRRGAWETEREVLIGGAARLLEIRLTRASGAAAHIILMRDMTDRRMAERRLSEAVNLTNDAFALFDDRDRLVIRNAAFERLIGAPLRAGMTLAEVAPALRAAGFARYADGAQTAWARAMAARFRRPVAERIHAPEGAVYLLHGGPLKSGGFAALLVDVSALERAREEAESAAQLKSSFLANITHEVRTPLNGVIAMAELLLESETTPAQRAGLELISRSGESLLTLVGDILDFARIDAGRMPLAAAPFDPVAALEETAAPLALQAWRKGLGFALRLDPGLPGAVVGDAVRVRQIAANLIGNAVKFTAAGRVEVRLIWLPGEDGERLALEVEDTGPGVPPDRRDAIFRPFEQAPGAPGAAQEGAGLGLSISRRLAEMMGGALAVAPSSGAGAVFRFEAPFAAAAPRARPLAGIAARVLGPPGRRGALKDQLALLGAAPAGEAAALTVAVLGDDGAWRGGADALAGALVLAPPGVRPAAAGARLAHWPITTAALGEAAMALTAVSGPTPDVAAAPGADVDADAPATGPLSPLVLVVEDNVTNQTILRAMLERDGRAFEIVATAADAVSAHERLRPGLTLMDLRLPDGGGEAAARRIRTLEARNRWPRAPIVAASADARPETRAAALAAGMDDFLAKPLEPKRLRAVVARWLDGVSARAAG